MSEKNTINRRQALKTLAAVTGAVPLASLPAWEKPVIEVGALPAHAQNSGTNIRAINETGGDLSNVQLEYPNGDQSDPVDIPENGSYTWYGVEPIDVPLSASGSACYRVYYPAINCPHSVEAEVTPKIGFSSKAACTVPSGVTTDVTLDCNFL